MEREGTGGLDRMDPVNEILFFYDARIAPLDLFAYGCLIELIGGYGEGKVFEVLRAAASERRTGEAVLEWAEGRLSDQMKGR
ncbi:hypothetical protein C772_01094 [Bhargavaea cecembensis DSE10]|uniref:Uncharacterized protein n=1 Tax=Bhargavaea cecembensis DSE10 TaxID=1235279 RepID=M7NEH5_9BACL|nr:hypothetical protein [Bhargavaea cecembensis]EMR06958.1 hypothetical protein C772_01094 [Bhargavaea cecembensis DSE10]